MPTVTAHYSSPTSRSTASSRRFGTAAWWSIAQDVVLLAGVALVGLLLFRPALGLAVLWNVLIPVAPALLVVAPGLWRNVCPMATLSLLPRRFGWSRRRVPSRQTAELMSAVGLAALLVVVPLRHLSLDVDGPLSAAMLLIAAGTAFAAGTIFERRGGWCASLCPIHPVERLYGFAPLAAVANRRCSACGKCASPCPDSTPSMTAAMAGSRTGRWLGHGLAGGFAGFICGWNQVPDMPYSVGAQEILAAYAWPLAGATLSLGIYLAARQWLCRDKSSQTRLVKLFATIAVCSYYWYRLPALIGFGAFHETGLLWDLSAQLPEWTPAVLRASSTSFLVWFLLLRNGPKTAWMQRLPETAA